MENVRLSKALLELMITASVIAKNPAIMGEETNVRKMQAAVEEYQSALNAWAGFEMEKAPVVAPPPIVVGPPPVAIASPPLFGTQNPFEGGGNAYEPLIKG